LAAREGLFLNEIGFIILSLLFLKKKENGF